MHYMSLLMIFNPQSRDEIYSRALSSSSFKFLQKYANKKRIDFHTPPSLVDIKLKIKYWHLLWCCISCMTKLLVKYTIKSWWWQNFDFDSMIWCLFELGRTCKCSQASQTHKTWFLHMLSSLNPREEVWSSHFVDFFTLILNVQHFSFAVLTFCLPYEIIKRLYYKTI